MSATEPREFTGRHMALITVTFFGVIIGVNLLMAVAASRTWTGLVVENSYVASQEFQGKADDARHQAEAGWTMDVAYETGTLVVRALDDGVPLALEEVTAFVRRPVGGHDDATVVLMPGADGYRGAINLAPGVWDVAVTTAPTALGAMEREIRITVR
ncbi:FixH family protein [Devosia sp.]|uniref:FixH family protein n=1 Tax=Devosia sp. TaxID=1871048 RepID=UPI0019E99DD8|nr:FixH family protein [Devosia sp.]MBE0580463.1 FixH family protein [Devosia sp.]